MKTLEIFEAILQCGKYVGFVRPKVTDHGRFQRLKQLMLWIQFTVVHSIIWFGSVKLILSLTIEDDFESRGLPLLCVYAFFTSSAFISTTTYFAVYREFDKFCLRLDNHRKRFGDHDSSLWIHKSRNLRLILYTFLLFVPMSCVLFIYFTLQFKDELTNVFWPFNFSTILNSVVTVAYFSVYLSLNAWHQLLIGIFFVSSSLLFRKEFELINNKLKAVISQSTKSSLTDIETIRQEHVSLGDCFESSKSLFKHYIFGIYAATVPVVGFFLYGAIRGKMSLAEIVTMFCLALVNSLCNLTYTLIGASLHAKAHEPYEMLNKVDILEVSDITAESVFLFMKRLTGPPISYSIYGMMPLDSTAILKLFGTLVTYAIVMLQFAGSTSSTVVQCYNATDVI